MFINIPRMDDEKALGPGHTDWDLGIKCGACKTFIPKVVPCCPKCGSMHLLRQVYRIVWDEELGPMLETIRINERYELKD